MVGGGESERAGEVEREVEVEVVEEDGERERRREGVVNGPIMRHFRAGNDGLGVRRFFLEMGASTSILLYTR